MHFSRPVVNVEVLLLIRVNEYLELGERVELLNGRFTVLQVCKLRSCSLSVSHACPPSSQEMLDMLRDHQNNEHGVRLEWIVIWLIVVEVVIGVLEVAEMFGYVPR